MDDRQLLERFRTDRDPSAFEAIVRRYGPLVYHVGRDHLHDPHGADDVVQSTFLVFLTRAGTIRQGELLGPWLCGVAYKISARARKREQARASRERGGVESVVDRRTAAVGDDDEDFRLLHEELTRLPASLRDPVWLCHIEGLSYEDAARRLRCPLGTFKARLGRGRDLLRHRLSRRGVAAGLALLAALAGRARATPADAAIGPALAAAARGPERRSRSSPPVPPRLRGPHRPARARLALVLVLLCLMGVVGNGASVRARTRLLLGIEEEQGPPIAHHCGLAEDVPAPGDEASALLVGVPTPPDRPERRDAPPAAPAEGMPSDPPAPTPGGAAT